MSHSSAPPKVAAVPSAPLVPSAPSSAPPPQSAASSATSTANASFPFRKRGGDLAGVGEALIHSKLDGTIPGLRFSPQLFVGYVLAYDPLSYSSGQRKLVWYKVKLASYDNLPVGGSIDIEGCDVGFYKTTTDVLPDLITCFLQGEGWSPLSRKPDTVFMISLQAVATSAPTAPDSNRSAGLGDNLEIDFTIVPKTGERHEAEEEFEVDVLIFGKRVKWHNSDKVYFGAGQDAHICGPLIDLPDAPITILARHFTPTPVSGGAARGGATVAPSDDPDQDAAAQIRKRKRV